MAKALRPYPPKGFLYSLLVGPGGLEPQTR